MREFPLVLFLLFGSAAVFFLMPRDIAVALLREGGPVESAQCGLYVVGALIAWLLAARGIWKNGVLGGAILAVFALRELDVQTMFTSMSVLKTRFFISPDVPLMAKLIAGIALAAVAYLVIRFLMNAAPALRNLRRERPPWAAPALTGVLLLAASILLDGTRRHLESLGVDYGETTVFVSMVLEETVELGIPLMFLIALLALWKKSKPIHRSGRARHGGREAAGLRARWRRPSAFFPAAAAVTTRWWRMTRRRPAATARPRSGSPPGRS